MLSNLPLFLVSLAIPLPLFYDIQSNVFFTEKYNANVYHSSFGMPLPVGLLSIGILGIIHLLCYCRSKNTNLPLIYMGLCLVFLVYNVSGLSLARGVSLSLFFVCMAFAFSVTDPIRLKPIAFGYIASIVSLGIIRFWSTEFSGLTGGFNALGRNFAGMELYQAWTSYSAVYALILSISVLLLSARKATYVSKIICSLVVTISLNEVLLMGRKSAAFVVIVVMMITYLALLMNQRLRSLICQSAYLLLTLTVSFLIILNLSTHRDLFNMGGYVDRLEIIRNFSERYSFPAGMHTMELTYRPAEDIRLNRDDQKPIQFLSRNESLTIATAAQKPEWGGHSNMFLEYFVHRGIVGFMLFSIMIVATSIAMYRYFLTIPIGDISVKPQVWIICLPFIASLLIGDTVNLDTQLPFYVINYLASFMSVAYFYGKYSLAQKV